jgi:low affinity Fe/Cu permease
MKIIYHHSERIFERIAAVTTTILGNSITFMFALALVIYWFTSKRFYTQDLHECIRDIMHGFIFITLFIIQKSFNRFSAILHLKVNELVVSHETASNAVIHIEDKTEKEITALSKETIELAGLEKEEGIEKIKLILPGE